MTGPPAARRVDVKQDLPDVVDALFNGTPAERYAACGALYAEDAVLWNSMYTCAPGGHRGLFFPGAGAEGPAHGCTLSLVLAGGRSGAGHASPGVSRNPRSYVHLVVSTAR